MLGHPTTFLGTEQTLGISDFFMEWGKDYFILQVILLPVKGNSSLSLTKWEY